MIVGFDPELRAWVGESDAMRPFERLPGLDGALFFDDQTRESMAQDVGLNVRRVPAAVLKPGSVDDVVRMVRYANSHDLRIAMRGQGHSQYGQSLVEGGIVVDSAGLRAVRLDAPDSALAEAGTSWGGLNEVTLAKGLTPPVMGDVMGLSVGGILSVGGWGNCSHRFGAVADNVLELDVVTGDGRLVRCSERRERGLFDHVLAGLGQVGLIVRARLRLRRAPDTVLRRELDYDDFASYVADAQRVATEGRFDHQTAKVLPRDGSGFFVRMNVGLFATGAAERDPDALLHGLRGQRHGDLLRASYADYLKREAPAAAALRVGREQERRRSASVVVFVPAAAAASLAQGVFADPAATAGLWRCDFAPLDTRRLKRPLFRMPAADVAFGLWLFKNAPASQAEAHAAMIAANRSLLDAARAAGAKAYPPYVAYSSGDWQAHYGEELWKGLVAAKRRYDPAGVLTPGPGIFERRE
jgi:FAD/FMN-containing dehydrogenase